MKENICFLQYSLPGGGAERKVCTLANYFAKRGHNVEIGLFGRNVVAYELDERVKVTFINRSSYEYAILAEHVLYSLVAGSLGITSRVIRPFSKRLGERFDAHFRKRYDYTLPIKSFIKRRPDAVLITMMVQPYNEIMSIIEPEVVSGKVRNPYIVMECSNPNPGLDSTEADDAKRNQYYPMAARCVAMTQGIVDYFEPAIGEKCAVIPNPLRDDLPDSFAGDRRRVVVAYCRLNRAKNLPLLIKAFAAFHSVRPDYSLEVYGQGELHDELVQLIQELGVEDCARILPFDPRVHERIRDCAMFVSSSDWEGFPNSVMEALAIGLPTISTDCDFGPRDMIRDHENGLLVPVGDARALASAMSELADDPALAERLSREATKARETYDVDVIGRRWLDLIEEVAREGGME